MWTLSAAINQVVRRPGRTLVDPLRCSKPSTGGVFSLAGYGTGYRIPVFNCSFALRRLSQTQEPPGHQLPRALELPLQRRHLPRATRNHSFGLSQISRLPDRRLADRPWSLFAAVNSWNTKDIDCSPCSTCSWCSSAITVGSPVRRPSFEVARKGPHFSLVAYTCLPAISCPERFAYIRPLFGRNSGFHPMWRPRRFSESTFAGVVMTSSLVGMRSVTESTVS